MIRYPFDAASVATRIAALDANWARKAARRTEKMIDQGRYDEASPIWSVVKPVFMGLQHDKCVFCERRFEGAPYGPVEWDLEHFRPKSIVAGWPDATRHPGLLYDDDLGATWETGYYWLSYELRNYAASCKVCNTRFKLNFFPVAGPRAAVGSAVDQLGGEGALLCYPLGELDDDPEDLISFVLTTAVPVHPTGSKLLRGRVIIDFFGLNLRDNIHRDRAQMIGSVGALLSDRDQGIASPAVLAAIAALGDPHLPHAACVRAFVRLWDSDPVAARTGYEACRVYGFDPAAAPPRL